MSSTFFAVFYYFNKLYSKKMRGKYEKNKFNNNWFWGEFNY